MIRRKYNGGINIVQAICVSIAIFAFPFYFQIIRHFRLRKMDFDDGAVLNDA